MGKTIEINTILLIKKRKTRPTMCLIEVKITRFKLDLDVFALFIVQLYYDMRYNVNMRDF
jgi:hypothetical protein